MLKVGDRVIYVQAGHPLFRQVGTIVYIDRISDPEYGVMFDKKFLGGHDLGAVFSPKCPHGHGWWCCEHELETVEPSIAHNAKDLYKVWGDNV